MKLIARISKRYHLESRNNDAISEWLWHQFISRYDNPLIISASRGLLFVVRYLHENGANIHVHDEWILKCAFYYGKFDVAKYLIENGANTRIVLEESKHNDIRGVYENLKRFTKSCKK